MGFLLGLLGVLIAFPPSFLSNPLTNTNGLTQTGETEPIPEQSDVPETSPSAATSSTLKPTAATSPTTSSSKVITGDTYSADKYGDVQIQITLTNNVVTSVKVLKIPDADSRSLAISQMAIPILTFQTIEARDSSVIQGASGASYTSDAWIKSLQSALSQL
jgi:uncharacterized protein with FMN-binding domain